MKSSLLCLLLALATGAAYAADAPWTPVGPDGGDARRFAADPNDSKHLYLGTTTSWIYQSQDGGATWKRLAKLSKQENLVLDSIIVDAADPRTLLIGAWVFDHDGGGLFISHDSGSTWERVKDMDGQSIRALAEAKSDSKVYVAGTVKGIYRSEDHGAHWKLISPAGSHELHEVESIAIDPADPKTIFAGTWHLPWKTIDGGANWKNVKQGLIDDSDVFSIILDPKTPTTMYASACSGIYKSIDEGELFHKVQGIPTTARRTRVLMQDPMDRDVVYAGTTEGLYQTVNAGAQWARLTGPDVVVNDVFVNPSDRKHVLMATDRSGVMLSDDAGITFHDANTGFSQRQVAALLTDSHNAHTIYAGVLNDKGYGGVFVSQDDGAQWKQQSAGLGGLDVFSLAEAADGTLFAGTNGGLFRWNGGAWEQSGKIPHTEEKTTVALVHKKRVKVTKTVSLPATMISGRVNAIDLRGDAWFAAASSGIYRSTDKGATWQIAATQNDNRLLSRSYTADDGAIVYAASRQALARSDDNGKTWKTLATGTLTSIEALATTPNGELWIGGREGAFVSKDKGETWEQAKRLPFAAINCLTYDPETKQMLVTSWQSTMIFAVGIEDKSWKWWDAGWDIRAVRWSDGRLVGASRYDGVVMQPRTESASSSGR